MNRFSLKPVGLSILLFCCSLCASGQVLRGSAINGTTQKPAVGDDVVLLKPGQGMQEEARTKTNSRGEFSFQLPDSSSIRAVRVMHEKLNYFEPVPPGTSSITVTVYESAPAVPGIHQTSQSVIFQAQGNTIQAFEIFNVSNDSQPPRAQPGFSFYLPEGAEVQSAQAERERAMPLRVAPVPQGNNRYTVVYTLLPGKTHFEIPYKLPYTGTLKFQPRLSGPVENFYVVTPRAMQFTADSPSAYQATDAGNVAADLKGMDMHIASGIADEKQLAFTVAGEGAIPQTTEQQSAGTQGNGRDEDNRPGGGMGIPNERPNPLSSGQWAFLGVLTLFLAGGAAIVFMTARPGAALAPVAQPHSAPLLDALKEEMFQLEADKVQGKIKGDDYEAAKAALSKTLQRAMRKKQ